MVTLPMRPATSPNGSALYLHEACGLVNAGRGHHLCVAPPREGWLPVYVVDTELIDEFNALVGELPEELHKYMIKV